MCFSRYYDSAHPIQSRQTYKTYMRITYQAFIIIDIEIGICSNDKR